MLSFVINAVRVIQRSELKETRLMRGNVLITPKGEAGWGGRGGVGGPKFRRKFKTEGI